MNGNTLAHAPDLQRTALLELLDYVNTPAGQRIFASEAVQQDAAAMIAANIFRCAGQRLQLRRASYSRPFRVHTTHT